MTLALRHIVGMNGINCFSRDQHDHENKVLRQAQAQVFELHHMSNRFSTELNVLPTFRMLHLLLEFDPIFTCKDSVVSIKDERNVQI